MKLLDHIFQRWRIYKALSWLPPEGRILDIGCHAGELFDLAGTKITGFGIDPLLPQGMSTSKTGIWLTKGLFPDDMPQDIGIFDAVVMLAVIEHIPAEHMSKFIANLHRYVKVDGSILISMPDPMVDSILKLLIYIGIADGMSHEQHHESTVQSMVEMLKKEEFFLMYHEKFQLGLNNFFVFRKCRIE
jgi:2-polyprenyl-3-methyl-5-hydroxy-6-metoxy-1,4-benzoquinol methylase